MHLTPPLYRPRLASLRQIFPIAIFVASVAMQLSSASPPPLLPASSDSCCLPDLPSLDAIRRHAAWLHLPWPPFGADDRRATGCRRWPGALGDAACRFVTFFLNDIAFSCGGGWNPPPEVNGLSEIDGAELLGDGLAGIIPRSLGKNRKRLREDVRLVDRSAVTWKIPPEMRHRRRQLGDFPGKNSKATVLIAMVVGSVSVLCVSLLVAIATCCVWRRRRKRSNRLVEQRRRRQGRWRQSRSWLGRGGGSNNLFRVESSKVFDPSLESISMEELVKATENFDYRRVIGDGGFGLVYRATLKDGRRVAVKRLAYGGMQGQREFEAEMETLGSIKHPNLVELLAYAQVNEDRLLVYEFMENGSLDRWLHDGGVTGVAGGQTHKIGGATGPIDGCSCALTWRRRVRIAADAASGLHYLHNDCNPNIIQRDIKSSNILLGNQFEAKIADFGLARLMSPLVSHVSTDAAGTAGYMAPEYNLTFGATKQADVYSFGMLLLELATRRRPDALVEANGMKSLASWAAWMLKRGRHMELLDPCLLNRHPSHESVSSGMATAAGGAATCTTSPKTMASSATTDVSTNSLDPQQQEVLVFFQIACDCVHDSPHKRPTMKVVLDRLSSIAH